MTDATHAHATWAALESTHAITSDGVRGFSPRVLAQKLCVNAVVYTLRDIYGVEDKSGTAADPQAGPAAPNETAEAGASADPAPASPAGGNVQDEDAAIECVVRIFSFLFALVVGFGAGFGRLHVCNRPR